MSPSVNAHQYLDSLNPTDADVRAAKKLLAESEARQDEHERRKSKRHLFHMPTPLDIIFQQPGGTIAHFRVIPYNIGNNGLAFLHRAFVHQGTVCQVKLVALDGELFLTKGTVTHAACLKGRVHLIGLAFEHPIDAVDFVQMDHEDDQRTVADPERAADAAKQLGQLVLANATVSELRPKYDELGRILFEDR